MNSNPIDLFNTKDTSFLRKIEFCSAVVHDLLVDLDDTTGTSGHKKESSTFNKTFLFHCNKVCAKMTVNPFTAERFQMLNGTISFPPEVIRSHKIYSWIQRGYSDKPEKEQPRDHEKVERSCFEVIIEDKDSPSRTNQTQTSMLS